MSFNTPLSLRKLSGRFADSTLAGLNQGGGYLSTGGQDVFGERWIVNGSRHL
jgi:hypothetical protein